MVEQSFARATWKVSFDALVLQQKSRTSSNVVHDTPYAERVAQLRLTTFLIARGKGCLGFGGWEGPMSEGP